MTSGDSAPAVGTMPGSQVRLTGDHFTGDSAELDEEFLEQGEASNLSRTRCLPRGELFHRQGDPVESLFVVAGGTFKDHSLFLDGKAYAHRLLGPGGLAGATAPCSAITMMRAPKRSMVKGIAPP